MDGSTHKIGMLFRLLAVLACTLIVSSCIVTYGVTPEIKTEDRALPNTSARIFYTPKPSHPSRRFVQPGLLLGHYPTYIWLSCDQEALAEDLVRRGIVREAIADPGPPPEGLSYSGVALSPEPATSSVVLNLLFDPIAILAYGLISVGPLLPYYVDQDGHLLRYDLYVDGELKKTYRYEIRKRGVAWVGLLPFAWVNFFTDSQEDVCRATLDQVLLEAERDGYL